MRLLFSLISFIIGLTISAQEYEVVSFDVEKTDLTARTNPRIDSNGRKCAVIKVYVNDKIAEARGSVIGDIKSTGMEKLIYIAHDSKQVELIFENHYPLKIVFMDYDIPSVTGQMTYLCKLIQKPTISPIDNTTSLKSGGASESVEPNNVESIKIKAFGFYQKGDFANALSLFKSIPQETEIQYYLGHMYNNGLGCDKDYSEAIKWYKEACMNDNVKAAYELANVYGTVYRNGNEYENYMKMAGDHGMIDAYYELGLDFYYGHKGLKKDINKAKQYLKKAAYQNNKDATTFLNINPL